MAVAEEMLDLTHPQLGALPGDDNNYALGSINGINIVIACLPDGKMGIVSAASVAKDLCRTFPSLTMGLMVGIGGGVPQPCKKPETQNEEDEGEDGDSHIILGDVVVSRPTGTSGEVQYDFGKAEEHGVFKRIGSLNKPPNALVAAVAAIRSKHERQENRIAEFVQKMVEK